MLLGIDASRANHKEKTGVEWYAFHIIQELKKIIPEEHRVILYSDAPLTGDIAALPPHWTSKVLSWPPKRLWTQLRLSLEMLIQPPDVLWVPAHVFPAIHPKKTVMTVHDVAAMRFPASYSRFERWYSLWSARAAVKHLWKIITPSHFTKRELLNIVPGMFGDESRIRVIHHGYDERYQIAPDPVHIEIILKKYNIHRPFLLSIGRLEEKKNTRHIIKAYDMVRAKKEMQLVLVGQRGYGFEYVKEAIVQSPNKHDIRLVGWLPPEEAAVLMHAAESFVFPSLYEGFGLPVLEAMASGTPVIAGSGSSLEEVGGAAALYVDPKQPEQIADAIQRLMQDTTLHAVQIQKGSEHVKQFSWVKAARETWEALSVS